MRDLFPVLRVLGMLMCMFALAMALPGAVSWWQQESVWRVYPLSMAVTMGAGLLLWWLLRHHRQIQLHAHGNEKQAEQNIFERLNVLLNLQFILGLGNQHPRDKRPQSQRQTRFFRQ